ncbi:thioredoxin family protein [Flavobacterium seoulense]|uniref:Thioredoxin n=1 Tax=Flavobacterium seoulense TaxID=1492738 RepID=A0A066WQE8_9FLAO|nr:thioredoxin fold domain-containing protein [Flavobacterium seoulense]KDN54793.1 thioredoxin [Flavobacterium seoulense]
MKKIYLIAVFCIGVISAQAQELKWHTDVKEAIAIGTKENKPLLMFFTGSDWCGWCIRLQKEVFKTPEFTKWAQEKVILVELDYPRAVPQTPEVRRQNYEIQNAFGVQGYPTIYFAKATKTEDQKVNFMGLGKTGYVAGGPTAWLGVADEILNQK